MFYLKKVIVWIREERAGEELGELERRLSGEGILLARLEDPAAARHADGRGGKTDGSRVGSENEGEEKLDGSGVEDGILWLTDDPGLAASLIAAEEPILIYLHAWNREADFPMAGYAVEALRELDAAYLDRIYRRFAGIPWEIAVTQRCLVRETVMEDCPALEELYAHPQIRRFLGGLYPAGEGRDYLEQYIQKVYPFFEYGIWTVVDRQSGEVIGRAGFRPGGDGVPELGYMIGVPWQRQGRAFEVCTALLTYARDELAFAKVRAVVWEENKASVALCRRLGFREEGSRLEEGRKCICFEK